MLPLIHVKSRLFCAGKTLMALLHKSSSISHLGSSICSRASLLTATAHHAPLSALARARSYSSAHRRLHSGSAVAAAAAGKGDSTPHTFLFTSESVTEVRTNAGFCCGLVLPMAARECCLRTLQYNVLSAAGSVAYIHSAFQWCPAQLAVAPP
jgi:hypothetical protein